jgi:hypothetical protein
MNGEVNSESAKQKTSILLSSESGSEVGVGMPVAFRHDRHMLITFFGTSLSI